MAGCQKQEWKNLFLKMNSKIVTKIPAGETKQTDRTNFCRVCIRQSFAWCSPGTCSSQNTSEKCTWTSRIPRAFRWHLSLWCWMRHSWVEHAWPLRMCEKNSQDSAVWSAWIANGFRATALNTAGDFDGFVFELFKYGSLELHLDLVKIYSTTCCVPGLLNLSGTMRGSRCCQGCEAVPNPTLGDPLPLKA